MVTTPAKYGGLGMLGMKSTPVRMVKVDSPQRTSMGTTSAASRPGTPSGRTTALSPPKGSPKKTVPGVKGENICVSVRFRPLSAREMAGRGAAQGAPADPPVWLVDEETHRIKMKGDSLGKLHKMTEDNDYGFGGFACAPPLRRR